MACVTSFPKISTLLLISNFRMLRNTHNKGSLCISRILQSNLEAKKINEKQGSDYKKKMTMSLWKILLMKTDAYYNLVEEWKLNRGGEQIHSKAQLRASVYGYTPGTAKNILLRFEH